MVAILKPQISSSTIEKVLPILFTSESRLPFSEKISVAFFPQQKDWLHKDFNGHYSCGRNPYLWARLVKDLYVESHDDAWDHQTLHWTGLSRYDLDRETRRPFEAHPEYSCSEDVRFEELWDGAAQIAD